MYSKGILTAKAFLKTALFFINWGGSIPGSPADQYQMSKAMIFPMFPSSKCRLKTNHINLLSSQNGFNTALSSEIIGEANKMLKMQHGSSQVHHF